MLIRYEDWLFEQVRANDTQKILKNVTKNAEAYVLNSPDLEEDSNDR